MKSPTTTIIKIQSFATEESAFKPSSQKKIIYCLLRKTRSRGLIPYGKTRVLAPGNQNSGEQMKLFASSAETQHREGAERPDLRRAEA